MINTKTGYKNTIEAITDWIDDHSEMLSEWEAESRYNMDFLVEKRKLDRAMKEIREFLTVNGIQEELRRKGKYVIKL
ncbi:MAG: type II secretion system protein GspK [Lachnospiraceae bacterium]|nr:type II secretion system protein GspK [Lachnospiraceae bacterium]MDY4970793.1 type II secretion system protein GspK [Lachnospiraceae bacterium]